MPASIIRHRSLKPWTTATLETCKGKSGTPIKVETVIITGRTNQPPTVTLDTNAGQITLETNSPDASVYTKAGDDEHTYRLREDQEAVA